MFRNTIKSLCTSLGKNNKSTYSVVAIATANGIFRPTFTMLKKDSDQETKKYTAMRECLTEMVAIPTYLACGELAAKCGEKLAEKAADKELNTLEQQGKVLTENAKKILKNTRIKDTKASLMLIGVCAAAGIIIPALCSMVMTPLMSKLYKPKQKKNELDITENFVNNKFYSPNFESRRINRPIYNNNSVGMKVGRL